MSLCLSQKAHVSTTVCKEVGHNNSNNSIRLVSDNPTVRSPTVYPCRWVVVSLARVKIMTLSGTKPRCEIFTIMVWWSVSYIRISRCMLGVVWLRIRLSGHHNTRYFKFITLIHLLYLISESFIVCLEVKRLPDRHDNADYRRICDQLLALVVFRLHCNYCQARHRPCLKCEKKSGRHMLCYRL